MKGINVTDEYANAVIAQCPIQEIADTATKAEEVIQEAEAIVEAEEEGHECPLCESELQEPISEERLAEHVDYLLNVLNEATDEDGELLSEEDELGDEDYEDDNAE